MRLDKLIYATLAFKERRENIPCKQFPYGLVLIVLKKDKTMKKQTNKLNKMVIEGLRAAEAVMLTEMLLKIDAYLIN